MNEKITAYFRENYSSVIVLCIVIAASIFRIHAYGDVRLSIAGNDTASYIEASRVPLFSNEILTGRRLLTTNLLYKIFEPNDGYKILVNGSIDTTRRLAQPSFIGIVIFQLILSLIGWGTLAFVIAENLSNPLMKTLVAGVILLFAFTPQIADWDSILMSESLTFSLFALNCAIIIKLAFIFYKNQIAKPTGWLMIWGIVHFVWTFLRDTNLFVSAVTFGLIAILFFIPSYRKNKSLQAVLLFLATIFIFGFITSSNSTRSQVQLINIYNDDLLSSPLRTKILKEMGMPEPYTSEYNTWFQENATSTLIKFMLTHPGYPMSKIIKDFPLAFNEIKQTYFKAPELNPLREWLMAIGDALHPENTTPFLISLVLLLGFIQLGYKNIHNSRVWAWFGLWLFIIASITLIPTILGDTWALNRHALFSTLIYRLFPWLFTIILIDISLNQNITTQTKQD